MVILAPVRFLILSEISTTVLLVKEMLLKCGLEMYWRNNPHTYWTISAIVLSYTWEISGVFNGIRTNELCAVTNWAMKPLRFDVIIYYYRFDSVPDLKAIFPLSLKQKGVFFFE